MARSDFRRDGGHDLRLELTSYGLNSHGLNSYGLNGQSVSQFYSILIKEL